MDAQVTRKAPGFSLKRLRDLMYSDTPQALCDVIVTPEIAKEMMKDNVSGITNRPMSRDYVDFASALIRNGGWQNTGEPIIFASNGMLNDGQHRLEAIIETGISCVMDLRFGIAREAFVNTNTGRKRSGGDALAILGYKYRAALSATARMAIAYRKGLPAAAYLATSNGEIVEAVEKWPELNSAVEKINGFRRPLRNSAVGLIAFFGLMTQNESSIDAFLEVVRYGEGRADSPPHQFREFLISHHIVPGTGWQDDRLRGAACGIIAWNAWQKSDTLRKLDWRAGQRFPVVEGLEL